MTDISPSSQCSQIIFEQEISAALGSRNSSYPAHVSLSTHHAWVALIAFYFLSTKTICFAIIFLVNRNLPFLLYIYDFDIKYISKITNVVQQMTVQEIATCWAGRIPHIKYYPSPKQNFLLGYIVKQSN